jgi:hypothetical protein
VEHEIECVVDLAFPRGKIFAIELKVFNFQVDQSMECHQVLEEVLHMEGVFWIPFFVRFGF